MLTSRTSQRVHFSRTRDGDGDGGSRDLWRHVSCPNSEKMDDKHAGGGLTESSISSCQSQSSAPSHKASMSTSLMSTVLLDCPDGRLIKPPASDCSAIEALGLFTKASWNGFSVGFALCRVAFLAGVVSQGVALNCRKCPSKSFKSAFMKISSSRVVGFAGGGIKQGAEDDLSNSLSRDAQGDAVT